MDEVRFLNPPIGPILCQIAALCKPNIPPLPGYLTVSAKLAYCDSPDGNRIFGENSMARLVELCRFRFYGLAVLFALSGVETTDSQAMETASPVVWQTNYREALAEAKAEKTL